jgi:hypothetical protein
MESYKEYYNGEGGGFPQVQAVVFGLCIFEGVNKLLVILFSPIPKL